MMTNRWLRWGFCAGTAAPRTPFLQQLLHCRLVNAPAPAGVCLVKFLLRADQELVKSPEFVEANGS